MKPAICALALVATAVLAACSHPGATPQAEAPAPARRPNILVILADDLGYSDIGAFGGEIPTPNLDELAAHARLLKRHYVAPTCSPTRAMLMSGTDNHRAGLGSMAELVGATPALQGKTGYEGYLHERVQWLPQMLRDAGYHTYMAGKWHLGMQPTAWPVARGFESSFAMLAGGGPHFAPVPGKPVAGDAVPYVEGDQRTRPAPGYYSSNVLTDKLLSYLARDKGDGKPFFAYLAYTAPHWPLQAPDEDIAKFKGRYDAGYDVIRQARLERQKALGLIPRDQTPARLLPASKEFPTWQQLTAEQRQVEARKMEVYAAMVHNMDRNIGRVIQYLKSTGQYDNTVVVFQSDNGAEPTPSFFPNNANNDNSLANLGRPLSNISYGPRWAEVSATPLRYFKGYTGEGGITAPAFIRLPGIAAPARFLEQVTHVTDIAPTLLDIAHVPQAQGTYAGRTVEPMTGSSLLPALRQADAHPTLSQRTVYGELFGGRYARDANWKLVSVRDPFSNNAWELYDIARDPGENHNLVSQRPDVAQRLIAQWGDYARRVGVQMVETKMPNVYFGATDPGLDRPREGAGASPAVRP